jgi:simple sugar transport system ATP-binding protein
VKDYGEGQIMLMRAVGISKWYGAVHALKNVSFNVPERQVVGLLGDNGAGKSTLIKIMSGAHRPDEGNIEFEGQPVRLKSTRDAMRLGIETIYQYNAMIPQMSIARNIFVGREPIKHRLGPFRLLDRKRMDEEAMLAIEDLKLHLRSPETPVNELSGGERQGVVLARAMHFKSKLLILDEPTNHLSLKETNRVLDHVASLKEHGIAAIFISHNIHHVYPIADRIVVMARGEKIADVDKSATSVSDISDMIV